MKLENYIRSLVPDLDKETVLEEIRITENELKNVTIPAYKNAVLFMSKWQFQNPTIRKEQEFFRSAVKKVKTNSVVTIYEVLQLALANLAEINRIVDTQFSEDIAGLGLTYDKAVVLRYVEFVHFLSRYARRYLNYLYASECAMYEGEMTVEEALVPADIEWIRGNLNNFCTAINSLNHTPKELEAALSDVPKLNITESNMKTVEAVSGPSKVDPFQMRFLPPALNVIFHIRMFKAQWQTNRYHAAKEEIKCLQLRKNHLENLKNGKPNARIQKEIDYIEGRIQEYARKNAEMEARYGN